MKGVLMQRILVLAIVPALCLVLVGCDKSGFQPVSGQVVFPDGSPVTGLDGGQVVIETTDAEGKTMNSSGAIDAQGHFQLGTQTVDDGAPLGKHKALITPPAATGDIAPPPVIDSKYESFETSGLEIEVKQGKNDVKLTVEPAKS
jgi:hypothetical protein